MTERTQSSNWPRRGRHRWLLALLCLIVASCVGNLFPGRTATRPQDWDTKRGPVIPHDNFPTDCTLCHEKGSWNKIRPDFFYDHEKETGVALAGAHAKAQCLRCHNDRGPVGTFAKRGCAGCHEDVHRGQLGKSCNSCHTERNWIAEGQVAQHNRTRFPLAGAHTAVACFRCHPGAQVGNFTRAPVQCQACHQEDLKQAKNPDHLAAGWTTDCQRCHKPTTWGSGGFDHSRFPLVGAHQSVQCNSCHKGGVYTGLSQACSSCHLDDFQRTTSPNHTLLGFSTSCQNCHNTVAWNAATFDHAGITSNCSQCHLPEYNKAKNPNHAALGYPKTCESCHTSTASWQGATFNHAGISSGCATCHLPQYNATKNPNHLALGYPKTCESCHTTASWKGATFNHGGITSGCATCHLPKYNATTTPNHLASGFPTSCENCHTTNSWRGAVFQHTFIIDRGPHRFSCTECHKVPTNYNVASCTHCHKHTQRAMADKHRNRPGYTWTSSACISCHPTGRH